jgi:HTH-type transcriptional regulator/antitoxin HigA
MFAGVPCTCRLFSPAPDSWRCRASACDRGRQQPARPPNPQPHQEDYLDVLGLIIADYEDSIYEHPEFSPVERLRHLMDEHSLSQAELARRAGVAVKSLSDVFAGKRRMSTRMSEKMAECFGVSEDFFSCS